MRSHRSDASFQLWIIINNVLLDGLLLLVLHHNTGFCGHNCTFKGISNHVIDVALLMGDHVIGIAAATFEAA